MRWSLSWSSFYLVTMVSILYVFDVLLSHDEDGKLRDSPPSWFGGFVG